MRYNVKLWVTEVVILRIDAPDSEAAIDQALDAVVDALTVEVCDVEPVPDLEGPP